LGKKLGGKKKLPMSMKRKDKSWRKLHECSN
jgi:hypothetical protein